jgi:hypothetical protein
MNVLAKFKALDRGKKIFRVYVGIGVAHYIFIVACSYYYNDERIRLGLLTHKRIQRDALIVGWVWPLLYSGVVDSNVNYS